MNITVELNGDRLTGSMRFIHSSKIPLLTFIISVCLKKIALLFGTYAPFLKIEDGAFFGAACSGETGQTWNSVLFF